VEEDKLILSPSRVKRWVRCKRSYHWRYNQHLVRIRKEVPMTLGSVVGEALADYYREEASIRSQDSLSSSLERSIDRNSLPFLRSAPGSENGKKWEKVVIISRGLLKGYHDWALPKDDFEVQYVEESREVELTSNLSLLAIPDAVVAVDPETCIILEHKVRYRYRPGDFNLDYQSVGSCLVSGAIGTIYNVLEYSKTKYHRTTHIRDKYELDYFRNLFIHIGEDILRTAPEDLYPMPMGRCHCEYFELCNAEQTGLDIEDVIKELYVESVRPKKEIEPEEEGGD